MRFSVGEHFHEPGGGFRTSDCPQKFRGRFANADTLGASPPEFSTDALRQASTRLRVVSMMARSNVCHGPHSLTCAAQW